MSHSHHVALALSANLAIKGWCSDIAALQVAHAWVARVHLEARSQPPHIATLPSCWTRPAGTWLPGLDPEVADVVLVADGEPTFDAHEFAVQATSIEQELQQRIIREVLKTCRRKPDGDAVYRNFRRTLIECGVWSVRDAQRFAIDMKIRVSDLFTEPSANQKAKIGGREYLLPCPECRRPRAVRRGVAACSRHGETVQIHPDAAGAVPYVSQVVLHESIWRSTVVPGLAELDLHRRLLAIGAQSTLWPRVDRYDLDVCVGDAIWHIDVKDHRSAFSLSQALQTASSELWYVIPDERRSQLKLLRERHALLTVMTSSDLIELAHQRLEMS